MRKKRFHMINYLDQFVITSYLFRNKFSKYGQLFVSLALNIILTTVPSSLNSFNLGPSGVCAPVQRIGH